MPYAVQPEPMAREIASLVQSTPVEGRPRGRPSEAEPPHAEQHVSQTVVIVYSYQAKQISPPDDSGMSLVSTLLKERFTGDLKGSGVAEHVRVVRPDATTPQLGAHARVAVALVAGQDGRLRGRPRPRRPAALVRLNGARVEQPAELGDLVALPRVARMTSGLNP